MKEIKRNLTIIGVIIMMMILFLIKYESPYTPYEEIPQHISEEMHKPIKIKKHFSDKYYEYFLYTIGESTLVGMSSYERHFKGGYTRVARGGAAGLFKTYHTTGGENGIYEQYIVYGENLNKIISKIKLDFGDVIKMEDISNEDYYLKVYCFFDKNRRDPEVFFYDENNNDITKKILDY